MPDRAFTDAEQARLYDRLSPPNERADFGFYLPLIMAARSVLDIGCGTGALLHMAREAGHRGRLVGIDPAEGMLAQARRRSDVEWVLGDLSSVRFEGEFELAVMTGHAFQVLLTDDEVRDAFASVHEALTDGGRFAFETRNPAARAWERWTPEHGTDLTDADGTRVRWEADLESADGELITFDTRFMSAAWGAPLESRSTLRFMNAATLDRLLTDAGFAIEARYGGWEGSAFGPGSPEVISIARRTQQSG